MTLQQFVALSTFLLTLALIVAIGVGAAAAYYSGRYR